MRLLRDGVELHRRAPARIASLAPAPESHTARVREDWLAALLTDIDGTLVDTNALHTAAWCDAFRAHGVAAKPEVIAPMIGMGADKIVPLVARGLHSGEGLGKAIVEDRRHRFLNGYLREARPTPGARALLSTLRDAGVKIYVASSAQSDEREALLRRAGVSDLVEAAPDRSLPSKPDASTVQAALAQAGVPSCQACLLGDTPYDVDAASSAGVSCIAVRCGGSNDEDLDGAIAIYDDPADFLRHLEDWTLPAAGISGTR